MIDELSRMPDPAPAHAALRRRGAHRVADGRWVVATAADVTAVLESPHARIGFAPDPARPVTALQAGMARFTDGPEHAGRRAAVERLLAGIDPSELRRAAAEETAALLGEQPVVDLMAIARRVPVAVLAAALGADPGPAVAATAALAQALAPPLGLAPPAEADATLSGLLAGADVPIAAMSVLFQALDATAGLIGNAAARLGHPADPAALVAEALRADCPVQLTLRRSTAPIPLGPREIPPGQQVVVVLAAAATDPAAPDEPPFGFGRGPHACPGAAHATALATGVLEALIAAGARPDPGPLPREPRLNLRIPARLPVENEPMGSTSAKLIP